MVSIKLGQKFLALIDKHFPTNSKLSNIFNKNTLKLSYSCTENLEGIIKKHNNKILNKPPCLNSINKNPTLNSDNNREKLCNCRNPEDCPLENKCCIKSVVYQCTISSTESPNTNMIYIGSTKNDFKNRWR